ncbi:putative transposase, MuDR, plant [Helianthus annuus]|nr:putative transposase, MuDR, plant [Helianthus annuus]KAJ0750350.1 putative transposase, MuDR, plant [Helianthus annuus]
MLEYVEGSSSANKNTSNMYVDNPVGNNDNIEIETNNAKEGTSVDGFNFDDIDFSGVFPNIEGHKDNEGEVNCTNENEGNREAEDEGGSEADCSHQSQNEGDDSEDSDYVVDNDYEVEETEVDMRDFNVFVDEDEEYVGNRNSGIDDVRNEVDYENEIDDNLSYESFDSLTDESMEDFETRRSQKLREIRNKQKGKSRMHEARFYLGQQFGSTKEVKEQVRRHAVLTKRELSFLRNDKARIRVVCEGNVPVYKKGDGFVKQAPKKGNKGKSVGPKPNESTVGPKPNESTVGPRSRESFSGSQKSKKVLTTNAIFCRKRKERLDKEKDEVETWTVKTHNNNKQRKCIIFLFHVGISSENVLYFYFISCLY